ncbi:MAG TPA: hypothetical protein VHE81_22505, partial [Lacipirellulaceae bacterium]|nr:hypothetical protein [Lacipirellulaceae bacterium]
MNPFDRQTEPDRYTIWQRLVAADCEAFARGEWSLVENDFDAEAFEGVRCFQSTNPDDWKLVFPDLASYRDSWLSASQEFRAKQFEGVSHVKALLVRTHLDQIDISGDKALAHKKFFGDVRMTNGALLTGRRQTL